MVWFWHVLLGALIAIIARLIDPDRDNMPWIVTVVIGIVGLVAAALIGQSSGWYGLPSWIDSAIAIALAIIFVAIYARTKSRSQ